MIQFTFDVPSKNPDSKIAILDLKVNLDQNGNVIHNFYEKPTKHPQLILANSAISYHQKITIMTQEAIRRMKNTNSGPKYQNIFLSQFMSKLRNSGYDRKFRAEVIRRSKKAFGKIVEKDRSGEMPMYRDRDTLDKLRSEKLKKGSWWNRGPVKYSSVVFIPATPGGILAKQMREREQIVGKNSKFRIKIVEKGGKKLKDLLIKKDPFPSIPCTESFCPFCHETSHTEKSEKPTKIPCDTLNVGYRWTCTNCKKTYEGETGRSARIRAKEHLKDLSKNNLDNPLVKHLHMEHNGAPTKFKVNIVGKYFDALTRQANEGVRIYKNPSLVINSKSEFNHPPVKRLELKNRAEINENKPFNPKGIGPKGDKKATASSRRSLD